MCVCVCECVCVCVLLSCVWGGGGGECVYKSDMACQDDTFILVHHCYCI